jgi:DNA-binding winged helix-turn-helix (wHTH) protein
MATTRDNSSMASDRSSRAAAEATLEFGRFRVLLRQRQLVADGVPIELGTRALDILLALLEADGSLVTKDELSRLVWLGIVVSEANLKVQICALRRALGEDRHFIRTEFGRGYRFTAAVRSTVPWGTCQRPTQRRGRSSQRAVPQWTSRRPPYGRRVARSRWLGRRRQDTAAQSMRRRARGGRVVGATQGAPRRNRANPSPTEQSSPRAVRHSSLSLCSFSSLRAYGQN